MGVHLHAITEAETVAHILDALDAGQGGTVVTPNLDHIRRCHQSSDYANLVAGADLVVPDGVPLLWASWIAGRPLPGLVAGSNLVSSLAAGAAIRGRSIFLLGGVEGSASAAADVLMLRFAGLRIVGTWCPPFGFENSEVEVERLTAAVCSAQPDIVYVGLGSPKQERLIRCLRDRLPNAWWLGVGVSFSFLAGDVRRAPKWVQRCGLEWLHRLSREPRRLARRYLIEGLPFGVRLMAWSVARRFRRSGK
jgi:N-acetylglucosaminyldiphosphoundecaprenol N-acetyl-beta-D-mannosaminyltransferase